MNNENSKDKIYRVYRKDIEKLPWYSREYIIKEVFCVARNANQAKGIALKERNMIDGDITKKDILVEEAKIETGIVLGYN